LSQRLGWISSVDVARVDTLIARAHLPTQPPAELDAARFLDLMAVDKKVKDGRVRLVLLKGIGESVVSGDYDPVQLRASLEQWGQTRLNNPIV